MLKGKCPKCGREYFGWALRFPRHQMCECGMALEITDGEIVFRGYSPFDAEKYSIKNETDAEKQDEDVKDNAKGS